MGGYIPCPIYRERLFADKSFFPGNIWPAEPAPFAPWPKKC